MAAPWFEPHKNVGGTAPPDEAVGFLPRKRIGALKPGRGLARIEDHG